MLECYVAFLELAVFKSVMLSGSVAFLELAESRWSCGNTLASDANGPDSIPGRGTLEDDSSFHPFGVGKLSTSFMLGV